MTDRTLMALMRVVPKATLSRVVGAAARSKLPASLHHAAARAFARRYGVDLGEAERELSGYRTFQEFFTRRLKPGARPIAPGDEVPVSPVDGRVYSAGIAEDGKLLQAKGQYFSLEDLLADEAAARPFRGGAYAILYLSPRDYHRIHAPLGGAITGYAYVPGAFWPVNPASVNSVPGLFALNERLVTFMSTPLGACAVVKVGAVNVGRIRALYDDVLTHDAQPGRRHSYERLIPVAKGDEIGVFEMGSTVIVLFESGKVQLGDSLREDARVRVGQAIGRRRS